MRKIYRRFCNWWQQKKQNQDLVVLKLPLSQIYFSRTNNSPVPHELQVVIPRLEVRETISQRGDEIHRTREIIMSSITVVSAPRREQMPSENPSRTAKRI